MKKILSLVFVILLGFVVFCYSGGKKVQVVVIGKSVHPYWSEVEVGVNAAAKKLNIKANFFVPLKEDISQQISTIESLIAKKVSGIAFAASDPDAITSVIKKAIKKNIPCIALDTDAPKSGRLIYIGTNNYSAGKVAGETMAKLLQRKGKVIICTGSLTAKNSIERMDGFKDALKKYPGIKILSPLCDKEDAATAVSLAEQSLLTHKDLAGFYGVYAFNGPAAAKAVKRAKKVGKIKIVCFDTTPDIIQYVKEGIISATIGQRPYIMGYKSVEILNQMATKGVEETLKKLPKNRIIDTGVDIVTKENLKSYKEKLKKMGIPVNF